MMNVNQMVLDPILYLVPDLIGAPGGIARYSRLMCTAMLDCGFNVRIIALADRECVLPDAWRSIPDLSYQASYGSRQSFIQTAVKAVVKQKPAIILGGHPNFAPLTWTLSRMSGTRFVSLIYGIDVWETLSLARRWSLNCSDRIISISQFTAERGAISNGFNSDKVRILNNCLDPQFSFAHETTEKSRRPAILTVARMSKAEQYKGQDYVISAMPILLSYFPQLIYHIVGDGDDRHRLVALTEQCGVTHAVKFHGFVSDSQLQNLYADSSIFVMPSRAEGFGFVFLEAMAHGLPVIGGNVDATPEVVVNGETGILVDPTSIEAIIAATTRLLNDDALRNKMGQAAKAHVARNFSYERFRDTLISYLSEL